MVHQRVLLWLIFSCFFCALLGLLGASFPPAVKKLGLFSLVMGALAGGGVRLLRERVGKTPMSYDLPVAIFLSMMSEAGRIAETYRQFVKSQEEFFQKKFQAAEALIPVVRSDWEQQYPSGWFDFLSVRYSALPSLLAENAAPVLLASFFVVELILAGVGAWLVWRYWLKIFPPTAQQAPESDSL